MRLAGAGRAWTAATALGLLLWPAWTEGAAWAWWGLGLWMLWQARPSSGRTGPPPPAGFIAAAGRSPWPLLAAGAVLGALIHSGLSLWHGDTAALWRQEMKLAGTWVVAAWWMRHRRSAAPLGSEGGGRFRNAWTLWVLSLPVAALVAWAWPRALLPSGAVPWAHSVALTVAVVAAVACFGQGGLPGWPPKAGGGRDRPRAQWWAWRPMRLPLLHPRAWMGLALAAGGLAVLFSKTRSAWGVLPWGLGLWVLSAAGRRRWQRLAWATAGTAVVLVLWWAWERQLPAETERGLRLLELWQELQWGRHAPLDSSAGSRWALWSAAVGALGQHPWVGMGQQATVALVQSVVPPTALSGVAPLQHVHNQFLHHALTHGLLGVFSLLWSLVALGVLAWCARHRALRWAWAGLAVTWGLGLLFNANLNHGPHVHAFGLAVWWCVLLESTLCHGES